MKKKKKPVTWEVKDPKIPPVRMENRVQRRREDSRE